MIPWWKELSDDEILARLTQRGMPPSEAANWVQWRESVGAAEIISDMIGEE